MVKCKKCVHYKDFIGNKYAKSIQCGYHGCNNQTIKDEFKSISVSYNTINGYLLNNKPLIEHFAYAKKTPGNHDEIESISDNDCKAYMGIVEYNLNKLDIK